MDVDLSVAQQRDRGQLHEHVGDGDLLVAETLAEGECARHIGRHRDLEDRGLPGFGQAAGDRASHRGELLDLGFEWRRAGRCVGGSSGRALDGLGNDSPLRPRPGEAAQVDPTFPRDAACERRGLDAAVGTGRLRLLGLGLRLLLGVRLPPAFALLFTRGSRRSLFLLVLIDLGRDLLALFADDRDPLADLDLLALAGEDLEQHAARVGLDLLGHLLGVELVERLALLDAVALLLQPADDRAGLHALAEPRQRHLRGHYLPTVRLIAASTSAACGTTNCSITGAKGSGANFAPTRSIGASSQSKAWYWTTAAISAPKPIRVTASCATTARFVFCTDATIASSSSGCSVRGSMISTETPSFSASSAAAIASCTRRPVATTVTSS